MSDLLVAVLLADLAPQPPPGVDPAAFRRALADDAVDLVAQLQSVRPVVVHPPGLADLAASVAWPGCAVREVSADPAHATWEALGVLAAEGGRLGAVVAADAPDLPGMLVGKLFSALDSGQLTVCPAADGRLVGLATALPAPAWLAAAGVGLETPDAISRLHAAAPVGAVVVGPGWHRLRVATDVARLDPALEGWDHTRALLSGR